MLTISRRKFYCGFVPTKKNPCNPSTYDTNLNIISGENYQGEYVDNTGGTTSGVDNQSVPYLQGSAQVNYHLANGAFVLLGETLIGKNNSSIARRSASPSQVSTIR